MKLLPYAISLNLLYNFFSYYFKDTRKLPGILGILGILETTME